MSAKRYVPRMRLMPNLMHLSRNVGNLDIRIGRLLPRLGILLIVFALGACAQTEIEDIGWIKNPDGTYSHYRGATFAPKNTGVQTRVEERTYKKVGSKENGEPIWKQVGDVQISVTGDDHVGVKLVGPVIGAAGTLGGAAIVGSALRGQDAPSATACQTQAAGTGANAGNITGC